VAAILSFSAIQNNDKVGVIFFSNKVEKFIPPKKGRSHILRIIRELIDFQPQEKGTDISEALRFLTNAIKKRSVAFLFSDFIDKGFENALRIANQKHDVIAVRVTDRREYELPSIGLLKVRNAESGKTMVIDSSAGATRESYRKWKQSQSIALKDTCARSGVDLVEFETDQDYIRPLINLFKKRESRL
jgi:uncharacterized protein (DUF58 family)